MSVSRVDENNIIDCARNPLYVTLQTNNYLTASGVASVIVLEFTNNPADGDTLVVTWASGSLHFTFKTTPDKSGLQLPEYTSGTLFNYINNTLVPALLANYTLNEYFYFNTATGTSPVSLTMTAKNTGAAYTISSVTSSTAAFATSGAVAGVTQVRRSGFNIICDVYIEGTPYYTKAVALDAVPTDQGFATFVFDNEIRAYLGSDRPGPGDSSPHVCPNMMKKYYFKYGEQYGGSAKFMETSDIKKAVLSMQNYEVWRDHNFQLDFFSNAPIKFLTNQPRKKRISPDQDEWLYFFHDETGDLDMYVDIYYTDGTSELAYNITSGSQTGQLIYRLPAGFHNNPDIGSAHPGRQIKKYVFSAKSQASGTTSQSIEYTIDHNFYKNNFFLFFRNMLGGYDTLWCRGDMISNKNYVFSEWSPILPPDYHVGDAAIIQQLDSNLRGWEFNTGWISKDYKEYLDEFFSSPDRLLISDSFLLPVNIAESEIVTKDTSATTFMYNFKLKAAFEN